MPYKSSAQRRLFYAKAKNDLTWAKRAAEWEEHTPKGKKFPEKVDSATLTEIRNLEDPNFIGHTVRAAALRRPFLVQAYGSTLKYNTYSSKFATNHKIYEQKVLFKDFAVLAKDMEISIADAIDYALDKGDVSIRCSCPAALYYGYNYIGTVLDYLYGIPKENRAPNIRNPQEKGSVCFLAGTQVLTSVGYRNIEDIKVGDSVFTHTGTLHKVIDTGSREVDSYLKVRLRKDLEINVTDNHVFPSFKIRRTCICGCGKPIQVEKLKEGAVINLSKSWAHPAYMGGTVLKESTMSDNPIGELKVNDFLLRKKLTLSENLVVSERLAYCLGWFLSDGSLQYKLNRKNSSVAMKGSTACERIHFSINTDYMAEYLSLMEYYNIPYTKITQTSKHGGLLTVNDKEIVSFCLANGNFTCVSLKEEKTLTPDVINWNKDAKLALLRGFFLGDGTLVEGAGTKGNYSVYLRIFNTNLQVMNLLSILVSEYSYIRLNYYDRKPTWATTGKGKRYEIKKPKRMYYFTLNGTNASFWVNQFSREVTLKAGWKEDLNYSDFTIPEREGFGLIPIKGIERITSTVPVYNIEVEGDNSYIVEGIVARNCKHLSRVLRQIVEDRPKITEKFLSIYKKQDIYAPKLEEEKPIETIEKETKQNGKPIETKPEEKKPVKNPYDFLGRQKKNTENGEILESLVLPNRQTRPIFSVVDVYSSPEGLKVKWDSTLFFHEMMSLKGTDKRRQLQELVEAKDDMGLISFILENLGERFIRYV